MKHSPRSKHVSTGGAAIMAGAVGAVAIGAFAIGALAIGRLVIRRMLIGKAKFKSLQIGELTVTRLRVSDLTVSDSLKLPPRNGRNGVPCRARARVFQARSSPLVDQGVLRAAVATPLTMVTALEMLVQAMKEGAQPREKTFVEAHSHPSMEELAKGR
jgi:hypothetical protein